ncbi:ATP-binding cassette domain-containing protein [Kocuria rosea]|uniref:ATP-binding cassette domain-containing protein n=1 Tax=Kocuria rosea TaxID=1275 RepID=UPI001FD0D9EB|nr:ATP-binding cassette domain-containing protein [Kocuria rosea]
MAALHRSREIVAEPPAPDIRRPTPPESNPATINPQPDTPADQAPAVRISGVVVRYPGRPSPALSGLDAEIPSGTITSVEGPSGSGKSTLLGVLAGTIEAQKGTIHGIDPAAVAWCLSTSTPSARPSSTRSSSTPTTPLPPTTPSRESD